MAEIAGQPLAKRALEIAAAGNHNLLFNGPPGTGKTMLARALPGIMPPLTAHEVLEITQLHSLADKRFDHIVVTRPFRSPHHSASTTAITGGGKPAIPGEISLSHHGVLFLDEFPEFRRDCLESLRQPLEDHVITLNRIDQQVTYPAHFMLIATANPCPCGYYQSSHPCTCSAATISRYQQKLSGPLLDRIDLITTVDEVDHHALLSDVRAESSAVVLKRVKAARKQQSKRYRSQGRYNATLTAPELKATANLASEAKDYLNNAALTLALSARGYLKVVRVARTIADLAGSHVIDLPHISEALQYRQKPVLV